MASGGGEKTFMAKVVDASKSLLPFIVAGIIFGAIIWVFFFLSTKEEAVRDIAYARGLITVAFTIGTVIVALVLVMSALFLKVEKGGDGEYKERIRFSKEVLTLMIGIQGTVLGFYFGNIESSTTPPTIANVAVSNDKPEPGDPVVLTITVKGGRAPFTGDVYFRNNNDPISFVSAGRVFQRTINTKGLKDDFEFRVRLTDNAGRRAGYPADAKEWKKIAITKTPKNPSKPNPVKKGKKGNPPKGA